MTVITAYLASVQWVAAQGGPQSILPAKAATEDQGQGRDEYTHTHTHTPTPAQWHSCILFTHCWHHVIHTTGMPSGCCCPN